MKENPALKLKREIQEIFLETKKVDFSDEMDSSLKEAFTFPNTERYVIVTLVEKDEQDLPVIWFIDFEERRVEYLPPNLSDYNNPVIVKISPDFASSGRLMKVDIVISERQRKLRERQISSCLDKNGQYSVVNILKLLSEEYDIHTVHIPL